MKSGIDRRIDRHERMYHELRENGSLPDTNLNKARQYFQALQRACTLRNQKRGKLDTLSLVRAANGSQHVFKQDRTVRVLRNTAVQLLVDISGSMSGQKAVYAGHTALQIIRLCELFNLDTEVIGFTSGSRKLVHCVYKKFGKRLKRPENFLEGFWKSLKYMCQNNDGDSILWGRRRLLKTGKDKRKIMFVLSDGMPSGPRGNIGKFTKDTVDMIEKEKYMEIYGIGILDDYVKEIYKDFTVVQDIHTLETQLLDFFKRVMYK